MMTYVLMIIALTNYGWNIHTTEFIGIKACDDAGQSFTQLANDIWKSHPMYYICKPKS